MRLRKGKMVRGIGENGVYAGSVKRGIKRY